MLALSAGRLPFRLYAGEGALATHRGAVNGIAKFGVAENWNFSVWNGALGG